MSSILPQEEAHTLQTALHLDTNQPNLEAQQPVQSLAPSAQASPRKRRKNELGDDAASPSEPRRLRRSHEACARCRSKKIKCDSKHPRCSACATAGTACNQEDRHRQTLTPRGHTERLEHQLAQCEALLKRHVQGFDLANLDGILAREKVDVPFTYNSAVPFQLGSVPVQNVRVPTSPEGSSDKSYAYHPQPMIPLGYPIPIPYGPPGVQYALPMQMQSPYATHAHAAYQNIHAMQLGSPHIRGVVNHDIKGQDPQSNDMSSSQSLAKNFGVSPAIVDGLRLNPNYLDREDLGVGSNELVSGRDRGASEACEPRNASQWITVSLRRGGIPSSSLYPPDTDVKASLPLVVWLPKDRKMVQHVVDAYFNRLNIHRPVLVRTDFDVTLNVLYDGQAVEDAGFVCCLYLVLALGTRSELNHRASKHDENAMDTGSTPLGRLMPHDWPDHDEFFHRAMSVKSYLPVAISSLQSLLLQHWYLYTERQGRTLWRLVGSLVRFAIELGLHHDPTAQGTTFTDEECRIRINLWAIVMVHDRGTSILLGRPLAIAPSDSNTPHPTKTMARESTFSDHFLFSSPLADIQADIINSLYMPTRQSGDDIMRHASRIMKSMVEFRRQLPESYRYYLGGTDEWPLDKRLKLVQDITEDQGLTLLKLGIARILLLRVLFNSKDLSYPQRRKALVDAIVTSHNIIIVHNQLVCFPDIAFFVSPIPIHIAAMVILYGHMSQCERLTRDVALEDVSIALNLLPRIRWRWERKDSQGGHPLISRLAEKVLDANLQSVGPPNTPVLFSEPDWDDVSMLISPTSTSSPLASQIPNQALSPNHVGGGGSAAYTRNGPHSKGVAPPLADKQLAEIPAGVFYPFYPENQNTFPSGRFEGAPSAAANNVMNGELGHLLTPANSNADYSCQVAHDATILDVNDAKFRTNGQVSPWISMVNPQGIPYTGQQG